MPPFETVIIVDWSAATTPSPAKPSENAIWIGVATAAGETTHYHRTRAQAETALTALLDQHKTRTLLGFDFAFGYPQGFAQRLTGSPDTKAVWNWLTQHLTDDAQNRNNRLDLAAQINAQLGGPGPFWVANANLARPHLPFGKTGKVDFPALGLAEYRQIESSRLAGQPKSLWQLTGPGAVGSQALTGLPLISRLAARPRTTVWPFDPPTGHLVIAEVYPSLLAPQVTAEADPIKDRAQVRLLSRALLRLSQQGNLNFDTPAIAKEEGWILGAGQQPALQGAPQ